MTLATRGAMPAVVARDAMLSGRMSPGMFAVLFGKEP